MATSSLNDENFSKIDFDDSKWQSQAKKYDVAGYNNSSRFENIYDPKDFLLNNGVLWLRTS